MGRKVEFCLDGNQKPELDVRNPKPTWLILCLFCSQEEFQIFLMKDYWLFFRHFHPVTRSLCCASIRVVQSNSFIGLLVEKRQRKTEIFLFSPEGTRFKSPGRTCKHKDSWSLRRTTLGWCGRCVKRRMLLMCRETLPSSCFNTAIQAWGGKVGLWIKIRSNKIWWSHISAVATPENPPINNSGGEWTYRATERAWIQDDRFMLRK